MTAEWIAAIAAVAVIATSIAVGIFTAGRQAQRVQKAEQDVNGLGRKNSRIYAFEIRAIAAEVEDGKIKAKLLALADLIEPK